VVHAKIRQDKKVTASVTATSQHYLLHSRCMVLSSYISVYAVSRKNKTPFSGR